VSNRRDFLATSGSALGALFLSASADDIRAALAYARKAVNTSPRPAWEFLSEEQAADVDAIMALIIPSDDGPGAREAGTVYFLDRSLATFAKGDQKDFTESLGKFQAGSRFSKLTAAQQMDKLRKDEASPFFQEIRRATIAGFLADPSYGGNRDKLGWKHIGFDDRHVWQPPFGDYDKAAMEGR
jgi:gluconate 2-dehydrogenase gamma chain